MTRIFSGKKLLVLGSSTGAIDIVSYAKDNGAVVYVADNLPLEASIAKKAADVPIDISTSDVNALCELVRREHIDGCVSGISGFNLLRAMDVSDRCGLRYHFTRENWDAIETKDGFRALCESYSVPCPKTYYIGNSIDGIPWDDVTYPVVVKPVDNGASRGVFVCGSETELRKFAKRSLEESEAGRIIIEEFCDGKEFTAHYVIRNGHAHLVCMDNRYPVAVHDGNVTTIPAARIYPSLFLDEYVATVDASVANLFSSLDIECAVVFVQGLYDKKSGSFSVFEAGMRSAAELPNRFLDKVTGNDYIHMLVDYVLLGKSDYDEVRDDPSLKGRCCGIVSFVARGATVGEIQGLSETVKETPSVIQYESRYPVGSRTPDGDTLKQLMIRFVMNCDSREQMSKDIAYINSHVNVFDDAGNNMVIRFDPDRLWDID